MNLWKLAAAWKWQSFLAQQDASPHMEEINEFDPVSRLIAVLNAKSAPR